VPVNQYYRQPPENVVDDLLNLFGGHTKPLIARLIESGKLKLEDVEEARQTLRRLAKREKPI
jgi:BlaI family transcriptional regulator, penicillinase repressor